MQSTTKYILTLGISTLILTTGCSQKTVNIDMNNDTGGAVMGLDYRDFQSSAQEMTESVISSGALNKPDGGKYILAISKITNDTMQHIDTDQLIKKIRVGLLKSGKVVVTTAISANGAEDNMAMQVRKDLRANDEFKQSTVAKKGTMIAPDLSLSGKIIQKNIKMDSDTQRAEYYFQMSLTDIKTGLALWEDEKVIGKQGSNKAAAW